MRWIVYERLPDNIRVCKNEEEIDFEDVKKDQDLLVLDITEGREERKGMVNLDRIKELSRLDRKDLAHRGLKIAEEAGEICEAILSSTGVIGNEYKNKDIQDIISENADLMLVILSIIADLEDAENKIRAFKLFEADLATKMHKWEEVIKLGEED